MELRTKRLLGVLAHRGGQVASFDDEILDHQHVDARGLEAAQRVLRRADDRLAAHVEAGVDEDRAAGPLVRASRRAYSLTASSPRLAPDASGFLARSVWKPNPTTVSTISMLLFVRARKAATRPCGSFFGLVIS